MAHNIDISLDADEFIVREVRRHPIGLIPIFLLGGSAILVLLLLIYAAAANPGATKDILPLGFVYIALGATIFLGMLLTYIVAGVYRSNELVITNENLIQVLQASPFSNKISRTNLARLEDVTVNQNGIFSHLFNYGTVRVETAGESQNFVFKTVGNPNEIASIIGNASEEYIKTHPELV